MNQQRDGIVIRVGVGAGFLVGGRATQLQVGRAALGFKTVAGHARARPGALVGSDLEEQRALQTTGLQPRGKLNRLLGPTAPSASSSAVFTLERTMPGLRSARAQGAEWLSAVTSEAKDLLGTSALHVCRCLQLCSGAYLFRELRAFGIASKWMLDFFPQEL